MNNEELKTMLADHAEWLEDNSKGKRANLRGANLEGAYLRGVRITANQKDVLLQAIGVEVVE